MKQFLIKYRHTTGTMEDWHREIASFIASLDGDPALKGKIGYRCMKGRDGADHNREKDHHSSQDREGSPVHPSPRDHGKPLRPDRCVTQRVMRRRAPGRSRCPGRKKTQNGHPNQKDKESYVLENLHKEHSLHQAFALGLIKSPPHMEG